MKERVRVKPTRMWADPAYSGWIDMASRYSSTFGHCPGKMRVMVLDYRDYLELRRAANKGKRK